MLMRTIRIIKKLSPVGGQRSIESPQSVSRASRRCPDRSVNPSGKQMELKQKGRRVLSAETTEPSTHIDKAAARGGGVLYAGLLLDRFLSFRCPVIIIGDIGRAFYVVQISLAIQQHKSTRRLRRGHSRKETDKRLVGRKFLLIFCWFHC